MAKLVDLPPLAQLRRDVRAGLGLAAVPGQRRRAARAVPEGGTGFQLLDPARQREIASVGGKIAQQSGRAHRFTTDTGRAASAMRVNPGRKKSGTCAPPTDSPTTDSTR